MNYSIKKTDIDGMYEITYFKEVEDVEGNTVTIVDTVESVNINYLNAQADILVSQIYNFQSQLDEINAKIQKINELGV
jgi:hypothetical protein